MDVDKYFETSMLRNGLGGRHHWEQIRACLWLRGCIPHRKAVVECSHVRFMLHRARRSEVGRLLEKVFGFCRSGGIGTFQGRPPLVLQLR